MVNHGERREMLEFIPAVTRLLDVGCSTGRFGATVRGSYPEMELWGIDPTPPDADVAQPYDTRLVGMFPDALPAGEQFDCIVFNDVLEHMIDPWHTLRKTHDLLTPGALVVASIPNVRHVSVTGPLIRHGRWDYKEEGILDRTHLRFFTRSTALELFTSTGYSIERVSRLQWPGTGTTGRLAFANRLLRGRLDDFFAQQYAIVARRTTATTVV